VLESASYGHLNPDPQGKQAGYNGESERTGGEISKIGSRSSEEAPFINSRGSICSKYTRATPFFQVLKSVKAFRKKWLHRCERAKVANKLAVTEAHFYRENVYSAAKAAPDTTLPSPQENEGVCPMKGRIHHEWVIA
jgi:hypothetical protein